VKYLCLVYIDEDQLASNPAGECHAYAASLRAEGRNVIAEALPFGPPVRNVRVRNGNVSITDGPFAETKEHLAGIYMFEAPDFGEAVRLAAGIPSASAGRIELRPIMEPGEEGEPTRRA